MRRYLSIILSIIILVAVIATTIQWAQVFYQSAKSYQSPLAKADLPPQESTLPKTANVVFVLVSGLGYDTLQTLELPTFAQLAQTGANALVQSLPPSYSQTAQITLITGASPELNDAPILDTPLDELSLVEIDTIFARAHEAQQKTAIAAPADWRRLLARNHLDETFFINASGPQADQSIMDAALPLLKRKDFDLIFIHLAQLDFAARHQGGPSGNAYQQASRQVDEYLDEISQTIDMSNTVLVIAGNHGYTSSGGYGGTELEVTQQPFIMVGEGIISGNYSNIHHTDIAPTISTVLGVAPPAAAQGRALFEMLDLNEYDQTTAQLTLAQQRVSLAQAYLAQIQGGELPDSLSADLEQAQVTFAKNNIAGAHQLGLLTQKNADTHIAAARHTQIRAEQLPRLAIVLVIAGGWFIIMWRRRGSHAGLIIVAAIITVGLYHILYRLQGYDYSISSLSSLGNFSELPFDIARRTAVSMLAGGGLLLILLMLVGEEDWTILLGTGYGFGVLVTFVFALPLFWAFWQNGFTINWYLPAINTVFWQITGLFETMIAAILGLLLPWPIMILNLLVNWVRHFLDKNPSKPETDILPGLRL